MKLKLDLLLVLVTSCITLVYISTRTTSSAAAKEVGEVGVGIELASKSELRRRGDVGEWLECRESDGTSPII